MWNFVCNILRARTVHHMTWSSDLFWKKPVTITGNNLLNGAKWTNGEWSKCSFDGLINGSLYSEVGYAKLQTLFSYSSRPISYPGRMKRNRAALSPFAAPSRGKWRLSKFEYSTRSSSYPTTPGHTILSSIPDDFLNTFNVVLARDPTAQVRAQLMTMFF